MGTRIVYSGDVLLALGNRRTLPNWLSLEIDNFIIMKFWVPLVENCYNQLNWVETLTCLNIKSYVLRPWPPPSSHLFNFSFRFASSPCLPLLALPLISASATRPPQTWSWLLSLWQISKPFSQMVIFHAFIIYPKCFFIVFRNLLAFVFVDGLALPV